MDPDTLTTRQIAAVLAGQLAVAADAWTPPDLPPPRVWLDGIPANAPDDAPLDVVVSPVSTAGLAGRGDTVSELSILVALDASAVRAGNSAAPDTPAPDSPVLAFGAGELLDRIVRAVEDFLRDTARPGAILTDLSDEILVLSLPVQFVEIRATYTQIQSF